MTGDGAYLFLVAYPVLSEVGGVVVDYEGNRVAGPQQAKAASDLVAELATAPAVRDSPLDVIVVPGWDKAPEGLRARYEAKREVNTRTVFRALTDEDEALIADARRALDG